MIACVERRFGATKIPHPVEWLSDNGSAYIAKQTSETAMALGLLLLYRQSAPRRATASRRRS